MKRCALLDRASRLAASAALGQSSAIPADATALLTTAAALYADGPRTGRPSRRSTRPSGFATSRRESGQVWIQAPQRLRFEYAAPEKKVFTYDSGEGRFFSPEDKQLTVRKLSPQEIARLPIVFLPEPGGSRQALRDPARRRQAPSSSSRARRIPIWPGSSCRSRRRDRRDALSYEDGSGSRTEFRFEGWTREKASAAGGLPDRGTQGDADRPELTLVRDLLGSRLAR